MKNGNVCSIDENELQVRSEADRTVRYSVRWCPPRCDCQDFQSSGIPCKHWWAADLFQNNGPVDNRFYDENGKTSSLLLTICLAMKKHLAEVGFVAVPFATTARNFLEVEAASAKAASDGSTP